LSYPAILFFILLAASFVKVPALLATFEPVFFKNDPTDPIISLSTLLYFIIKILEKDIC